MVLAGESACPIIGTGWGSGGAEGVSLTPTRRGAKGRAEDGGKGARRASGGETREGALEDAIGGCAVGDALGILAAR